MAALLASAVAFPGCSCEDSEPPGENVQVVQPEEGPPAQPGQAAPEAQEAERQVGESVLHGPADYLRTTVITVPRTARKKIDTIYTQNEIEQFKAIESRYPHSLKELEQWRGEPLPEVPKGHTYKYDSKTGKLEVVPVR
ncbi:MAG: hypothetical protein ACYS1C_12900 [Planctomycetota bacterium]|jgi:hypothetical protein